MLHLYCVVDIAGMWRVVIYPRDGGGIAVVGSGERGVCVRECVGKERSNVEREGLKICWKKIGKEYTSGEYSIF